MSHPNSIDPRALTSPNTANRLGVATWRGVIADRAFATAQYSQKFWQVTNNGGTSTDIHDSPFLSRGTTSGVPASAEYSAPYFDSTDPDGRHNRQATASISYLLGPHGIGSHELKSGVEYFVSTRETGNSQTSTGYIFQTDYKLDASGKPALDANGRLIPVFTTGTSRLATWMPTRGAAIDITTTSAFATDRWVAGPRLTFDLGVRYEHVGTEADLQTQAVLGQHVHAAARRDLRADRGRPHGGLGDLRPLLGHVQRRAVLAQQRRRQRRSHHRHLHRPVRPGLDFAAGFDPANYPTISGTFPTANVFFAAEPDVAADPRGDARRSAATSATACGRAAATCTAAPPTSSRTTSPSPTARPTIIRNGVNFGTFDNAVYRNSDLPKREYDAVDLQSGWQRRRR